MLLRIIIPQVIPVAIPTSANGVVGAIKNSSIVLAIGIADVLHGSLRDHLQLP